MNRLQTYHQKLKKEDFTEVKSSFLVCDSVGVRTQDPRLLCKKIAIEVYFSYK